MKMAHVRFDEDEMIDIDPASEYEKLFGEEQ